MQFENPPEIPIVITEARVSVGDARARTESGVGPDGVKVMVTYKEGEARDAEFLINLVNQGSRRITDIAVDIQNAPFWAEKHYMIPSHPISKTAVVPKSGIDPQGSFDFKVNMLLEEKEGDGNLMGHLYDFKVRVVGVRFDSEPDWVWAAPDTTKRTGVTRLLMSRNMIKNEAERKFSLTEQNQKGADPIRQIDSSMRPTILYRERAAYTQEARDNKIEGLVILSVVFGADAQIRDFELVQGLPYGLNEKAIEAAKKIRFEPAMKDGQPVSVRGNLQFTFNLHQFSGPVYQMESSLRPRITYREKAQYTQEARDNNVEGTVVLSVVFGANGHISVLSVIRELPHGLTQEALEAARKIRFNPAMIEGKPVNVRGNLEFAFNLGK